MKRLKLFALPYIAWMVLFTVLPMFLILYYAFTDSEGAFTLQNLWRALDPMYLRILWRSVWMSAACTVICLAIGYPVAYILSRSRYGELFSVLFILPMWMNFLLRTYAWMSLLENTGIINTMLSAMGLSTVSLLYTPQAVMLGMVYNYLPFMILPIYTILQKQDKSLLEAARDLGCNPIGVFTKVTLPLSVPGVISGIMMVFMPGVTTFVISRLLGGAKQMLFGDLIEQQYLTTGNWNVGSMLAVIMLVIILISMAVLEKFGGGVKDGGGLM
ncbi:MAG: ABC transporter permease [Christensenellales bacterium]|jgi:spermidine/putrescine transport system permease protein